MAENNIESLTVENELGASVDILYSQSADALLGQIHRIRYQHGSPAPLIASVSGSPTNTEQFSKAGNFLLRAASILGRKSIAIDNSCTHVLGVSNPWTDLIRKTLLAITTSRGQTGRTMMYMYIGGPLVEDTAEEEQVGAVPPWKKTVLSFQTQLRSDMGLDVVAVPEGLQEERLRAMRDLYNHLVSEISGGISERYAHGDAAIGMYSVREFGENQSTMWAALADELSTYASHERAEWVMPMIRKLWEQDAKPVELSEMVELPTFVRGGGDDGACKPPSMKPAHVTRKGLDQFMLRGLPSDQNTGWITPDMVQMMKFVDQEDGSKKIYLREGNGIPEQELILAQKSDKRPNKDADLTFGASWKSQVPREQVRKLPFTIVTIASQLFHHITQYANGSGRKGDSAVQLMFDLGLGYLLLIAGMCSCEFMAMHSRALMPKGKNPDLRTYLRHWSRKQKASVPHWMRDLVLKGKEIRYVTAQDLGYFEADEDDVFQSWDKEGLAQRSEIADTVGGKEIFIDGEMPTAPFVERLSKRTGPRVTASGLTSTLQVRCAIALGCLMQYSNLADLDDRVREITSESVWEKCIQGCFEYLSLKPGAGGKKLNKAIIHSVKYILGAPMTVEVPQTINQVVANESQTGWIRTSDKYIAQMLTSALDLRSGDEPASWEAIKMGCVAKAREMNDTIGDAMGTILEVYGKMDIHAGDTDRFRILNFLMRPDHMGGYAFTNAGGLSAYGYASDVQKAYSDPPLDDNRQPASHEYMAETWRAILRQVTTLPITRESIMQNVRELMKGTSGGDDKWYAKTTRAVALNTSDEEDRETKVLLNTNKKSTVIPGFGYLFMERGPDGQPSEILMSSFSRGVFNSTGERSVPSRVLRIIFNVDNISQLCQRPIEAMAKEHFKHDTTYSMEHKKSGQMFDDNYQEILASLRCEWDQSCIMAYDASALDQHEGTGDRRVFIGVVNEMLASAAAALSTFEKEFGIKYFEWVKAWATKRLENYFTIQVSGAPTQAFLCNTQASGERLTGIINSITSKAIVDFAEYNRMGVKDTGPRGGIWGDDIWRPYSVSDITPENVMQKLEEFEQAGRECGQDYTYVKALSGKLCHFLQNCFKSGQTFSRAVALTHERWFDVSIRSLSSLMAKVDKMCFRGGNYRTCHIWKMAYLCSASQTSVFGKKFVYQPAMILYPGGVLNQVVLPFASENSKAWLSLNALNLGFTGTMIEPPSAVDDREIGKQIFNSIEAEPSRVHICGRDVEIPNLGDALDKSWEVMTDPERVPTGQLASEAKEKLKSASIQNWSRNQFFESVGTTVKSGVHARWFKELEMKKMGAFPGQKQAALKRTAEVRLKQTTIQPRHKYRIGDHTVEVAYSGLRVTISRDAGRKSTDYLFTLRNMAGAQMRSWKGRWHPFLTSPLSYSAFLLWTGVGGKACAVGSPRDALIAFSPSHFRPDLTPSSVVSLIMQNKKEDRKSLLAGIGFKSDEIARMQQEFQGVGELRDEEEFDEYSSTPGPLKSAARDRLEDLLRMPDIFQTVGQAGIDLLENLTHGRQLKQGVLHLLTEMCYTECNISCNLDPTLLTGLTPGVERDLFNIPRFTLRDSS